MAKICKSCGNYYKGDYCDKCGYGKEVGSSKAAEKYKKATKPERFRTDEDKAVYAKWEKEKRQAKAQKKKDPYQNVKFLIIVGIVAVGIVLFVLYKGGIIFSNTREEVIEQYFTAIQNKDFDSFVKCFPDEIRNDYEAERKELGLTKDEYMNELYADFDETYGEGYTIDVDFGKETKLDTDDYDMTSYEEQYGSAPTLLDVYEIAVTVTFSGSTSTEEANLYLDVAKDSGYWRIFYLDEDSSTVVESSDSSEQTETE